MNNRILLILLLKIIPHLNELADLLFSYVGCTAEAQSFSVLEEPEQILVSVRKIYFLKGDAGSMK